MTWRHRFARCSHMLTLVVAMCALSAYLLPAQSYTLRDIFVRIRVAEDIAKLAATDPALAARVDNIERFVGDLHAMDMSLDTAGTIFFGASIDYPTILRWNRSKFSDNSLAGLKDTLQRILVIANSELRPKVLAIVGADSTHTLYDPFTVFQTRVLSLAKANNTERLREFEIKYGPDSPKLNLAEAGLNYLGQLVLPGVFLSHNGGPSPLEMVAKYSATNLTASRAAADSAMELHVVSSAQLGFRWYNFRPTCGQGNHMEKILNPCQITGGLFIVGPKDAALLNLFSGGQRRGFYISAMDYRVGVILGQERRLVFGLETQVLPYIF